MDPIYEIRQVSTVKGTPLTYVLVWFWLTQAEKDAQAAPYLVEEFLMDLATSHTRKVRDPDGSYVGEDGTRFTQEELDEIQESGKPFPSLLSEQYDYDPVPQMLENISKLWATAEMNKLSGDITQDASKPFFVDGQIRLKDDSIEPVDTDDAEDPRGVLAHPEVVKIRPNRLR